MARLLAALAALLVLATACGGDSEPNSGTASSTSLGGDPSTAVTSAPNATATTTRAGSTAATSPNGPRSTTGRADESTKGLIDDAAARSVGGFAGVLLAAGIADRLVLDIRFGPGATVTDDAVTAAVQALRTYSGKPVDVFEDALTGVGEGTHTADDIRKIAENQGIRNRDGVAVLHLLYLGGRFEKEGTLGVAVGGDTFAVFPDTIDSAVSPLSPRSRLERAVVIHELGHVLGLVDLYLNRNRADADHPGHSPNRSSVMFWAVETSLVGQVLGGPPPVDFDGDDIADLKAIRAGAARG